MNNYLYLLIVMVVVVFSSFSEDCSGYPSGAPAGYTGSPADGRNCTQCHGGSASPVTGWITSGIDSSGYIPGQTYSITVTVTGSGRKGFEVSPQDIFGNLLGTLTAGQGNKLVSGDKYVTHSSASNSNPMVWTFEWTAPDAGTGPVTFYGAFALNEPVTKLSELTVQENTGVAINENRIFPGKIYPDPVSNELHIDFGIDGYQTDELAVLDLYGRKVIQVEKFNGNPNNRSIIVPVNDLADGVYVVTLQHGKKRYSQKFIVRK